MLRFKDWACTSLMVFRETIEIIGGSVVETMWVTYSLISKTRFFFVEKTDFELS